MPFREATLRHAGMQHPARPALRPASPVRPPRARASASASAGSRFSSGPSAASVASSTTYAACCRLNSPAAAPAGSRVRSASLDGSATPPPSDVHNLGALK